jgi:hypothetical protein
VCGQNLSDLQQTTVVRFAFHKVLDARSPPRAPRRSQSSRDGWHATALAPRSRVPTGAETRMGPSRSTATSMAGRAPLGKNARQTLPSPPPSGMNRMRRTVVRMGGEPWHTSPQPLFWAGQSSRRGAGNRALTTMESTTITYTVSDFFLQA